jgi:hypothetical protein
MNKVSVEELERAALQTDLFLVYEYKSAVLTPDPTMIATFRANLPAHAVELTDARIEQIIVELVHVDGVTGPNEIHEIALIDDDVVAFWRLTKVAGRWKTAAWRRATVPYVPVLRAPVTFATGS